MNNRRKQLMLASAKEYCKCVVEGKTLKYNQIVKNGNFNGTSEWTSSGGTFSVSNNICSFDATAQNGDIRTIVYYDIVVGHKYLVYAEIKTTTATSNGVALYFGYSSPDRIGYVPSNTEWNKVCGIKQATAQGNSYLVFIRDFRASDRDTIYIKNVMCIDLTVLGLDSITNASDFFATDLGKYIAKGNYLPYEPNGKFIHAQSPINFEGVNIWNEKYRGGCYDTTTGDYEPLSSDYEICSKDKIRVKPNTKYYVYCGKVEIGNFAVFYDKNGNFVGYRYYVSNSNCITTPENAYYMNITFGTEYGTTYLHDICISKNVWNENWENGIWYYGSKLTGGGYADYICSKDKIKVYPNTKYFYYCGTGRTNDYIQLEFYDKNGTTISRLIRDNKSSFVTPNDCYSMAFYINDSYGNVYNNDIGIFYYGYHKYCGNSVFESGLTLQNGDKYKSWGLDEISYNNLIPNANQDYVNSNADARANIILSVYDYTNNISVFAEGISVVGFYEFTFTSNTTTYFGAKIYNSGVSINQNFAENISLTNGHLYYMSLNVSSCDASFVGGLRIANLCLIDLTQLGLNNVPQKLGLFLKQNYRLPVSSSNRTIKVQIVRTFKEVDLSSLTWHSAVGVYYVALPKDIKIDGQAIAEKYANDDIWIAEYPYDDMNLIVRTDATPSGKALLELATQEINVWYHLEINDYHDFEQYSGTIYKLDRDLSDLNVFSVTADIGNNMGSLFFLDGRGNYNDYCYENGYIYVKSDDIENAWAFDLLINNIPNRMVSRRIINVESKNGIDLDFSKE